MIKQTLDKLVDKHLINHPIWENDFFRVIDNPTSNPQQVWHMLVTWVENMMHASYGFQTYVLTLAARANDEKIRRLLVENAWSELGDSEYPQRSHFQMVCNLARLCGISEEFIKSPRLLPSSTKHVSIHIERCQNAKLMYGLGMIFLIENLTKIEFEKVLRGFVRYWERGTNTKLEEFALGNGVSYFSSNIEADCGHAEDVKKMIIAAVHSDSDLVEIELGMAESISLRNGFLQGVYDEVYTNEKILEEAL
jgi:pyrroloquinoline quinone (PQQ) biosynthesis protein C